MGPAKVTDLAKPFPTSLPAISKHVRILESAGLVSRSIDGRVHRIGLAAGPLRHAETWLDPYRSFWEEEWRALDADLANHPTRTRGRRRSGRRSVPRGPIGK